MLCKKKPTIALTSVARTSILRHLGFIDLELKFLFLSIIKVIFKIKRIELETKSGLRKD